jgi:hypothetical protein
LSGVSLLKYVKFFAKYEVIVRRKINEGCMMLENELLLNSSKMLLMPSSLTTYTKCKEILSIIAL